LNFFMLETEFLNVTLNMLNFKRIFLETMFLKSPLYKTLTNNAIDLKFDMYVLIKCCYCMN